MPSAATIKRFVEAFIAVFVVSLAADPIFAGGQLDLGSDGLKALVTAIVAAAALAARRAMVTGR